MPSVFLVDDPDPHRRRRALGRAAKAISDEFARPASTLERGSLALAWGTGDNTPVERFDTPARSTLVFGDALPGPTAERAGAEVLARHFTNGIVPVHDGLHLAISISDGDGWALAGDILGIVPIYHTALPAVRMVATNPGLFRSHEQFHATLNRFALTSLFVTNGLLGDDTIFEDVRRVAPGHFLAGKPGEAPREVLRYRVPVAPLHHDVPLEECAHRLHESLVAACGRHIITGVPHTLLLSGGLDSRLLAGVLARQGVPMIAVTRGLSTDGDYRCARHVARHLGLPHRLAADSFSDWTTFQARLLRDGLTSSPGLGAHSITEVIRGVAPRSASGFLMDAIIGGSHIRWCYSPASHRTGFAELLQRLNRLGIDIEVARALLRKDVFGDSVDAVVERVRQEYEAMGSTDLERTWRFDLAHRQRFHVGSALVRQMPSAWPVAPQIDREVLETAGGIPLGMLADRVVEREILVRHHRDLARLPLDRAGATDTMPLDPTLRGVLREIPGRIGGRIARSLRLNSPERRYYHRLNDFDGAGWVAIRQHAESAREAAYAYFDRKVYDAILPPPGMQTPEGFRSGDSVGRKTLIAAAALIMQVG